MEKSGSRDRKFRCRVSRVPEVSRHFYVDRESRVIDTRRLFFHRVQAYREPIINCRMPLSSPWDKYMGEGRRQEVDHSFARLKGKHHSTISSLEYTVLFLADFGYLICVFKLGIILSIAQEI